MAILLENMYVESYRGISKLHMNEFNHVNILVGDNNAGKTSIMEMICAMACPTSLGVWNAIAEKKSDRQKGTKYFYGYKNIFPIDSEMKLFFQGDFSNRGMTSILVEAEEYTTSISERERDRINGFLRTGNQNVEDSYVDTKIMEICIKSETEQTEFEVYDFQKRPPKDKNKIIKMRFPVAFLEPRDRVENDFVYLNKAILDMENYQMLVGILKEFDSKITDIVSVEEMGSTVYYVRTSEHKNAVPISVYGDGLIKALIIFAALAVKKNGIVLIDEVETSIHTSAMKAVFRTLISWARKLNIQLFISTHSEEALKILLTCDAEYNQGINVYTLFKKEQKNYVRKLSCQDALELNGMGMDLR